jgi:hypothetical protein
VGHQEAAVGEERSGLATLAAILSSPLLWKTHKPIVEALAARPVGVTGPELDALLGSPSAHKRLTELRALGVAEIRGIRARSAVWVLTWKLPATPILDCERPTAPQPHTVAPPQETTTTPVGVVLQEDVLRRCLPVLRGTYLRLVRHKDPAATDIKKLCGWVAEIAPEPTAPPMPPLPFPKAPPKKTEVRAPWWTGTPWSPS